MLLKLVLPALRQKIMKILDLKSLRNQEEAEMVAPILLLKLVFPALRQKIMKMLDLKSHRN